MHSAEIEDFSTPNSNLKVEKINDYAEIIEEINPLDCVNWKFADRQDFERGDLRALADNIQENGQLQPIIVRRKNDKYEVIAGERRWRACNLIEKKVKAIIKDLDDADAFVLQAFENSKYSLSSYSQGISYYKILEEEKISQRKLAERLKISKSSLHNILSYGDIPKDLWIAVGDMSKVTIKTACYLKQLLESSPELLDNLIGIANEIRKGVSAARIKRLLAIDENELSTQTYNFHDKVLFKLDKKKIVLPISGFSPEDLEELIENLQDFLIKNIKVSG